jgi:glycosyltransferase involved in cell wall biosynthesis
VVDLINEWQADVGLDGARQVERRLGGADRRKISTEAPNDADRLKEAVDISVVMPCLNEEGSVGICVKKAWEGIQKTGRTGEVIVADNGSTDRSVEIAEAAGARIVHQPARGYGNAYLAGFAAARGSIIVMGDADDSYDFTAIQDLVAPIVEQGHDYVHGSRLSGQIERGAMSWSHRHIGNPVLTSLLNVLFKLRVSDAHSGFRVFTRDALQQMDLQCEGMEFASEIVIKAAGANLNVTEVPITYHPRIGESKLNSISDAWRHIRFLLLSSPTYLFLVPGLLLLFAGVVGQLSLFWATGGVPLIVAKAVLAVAVLSGVQVLVLSFAASLSADRLLLGRMYRLSAWVSSGAAAEAGFVAGTVLALVGLALLVYGSVTQWGALNTAGPAVSFLVISVMLALLGITLLFDSLFLSFFEIKRRRDSQTGKTVDRIALRPVRSKNRNTIVVRTNPAAAAVE